jgi:hypothetical protein
VAEGQPAELLKLAHSKLRSNRCGLKASSHISTQLGRVHDAVLDHIFSFVGAGEHLYAAGVYKQWRCIYMQICVGNVELVHTIAKRNALVTESRLQLALS